MIVDDEVDAADGMAVALTHLGFDTLAVYDAAAALATVREAPEDWDVILTDHIMPNMTGLELIHELRRLNTDFPVLLYSGFAGAISAADVRKAGARGFIQKPLRPEIVANEIRSCLRAAR